MDARDFRGIGRAAQEELRRRALCLIEQQGLSQAEAARRSAYSGRRSTSGSSATGAGEDGVLDGRRVSPRRGKGLLTAEEAAQVKLGSPQNPGPAEAAVRLVDQRAVRDLIALRFAKRLGLSTVQLYLQRWGLTPQKPLARAKERQPAAIAAWLETTYPRSPSGPRPGGGDLLGRRDRISNQDQIGRSYAPRGRTPVVTRTAKRVTQA